jgi:hypothetical protein
MAKARTGSLYLTKSGWRGRITVDVDGVAIQRSFDLKTHDKAAARVKLRRLAATHTPSDEEAKRLETFEEAARRIIGASLIASKRSRLDRLVKYAFPAFGPKPVDAIRVGDIRDMLEAVANLGQSRQQCVHLRNDVSAVLGELWRDEMLPENVAKRVRIPKHARVDKRERCVLTDDELLRYLAWEHPDENRRASVLERQTMACVSRMFGGLRLGDIRAMRWEALSLPSFEAGWAPRKKTARPQLLEVPEILRPILRDWWERAGRPAAGPMFPVRLGPRAGEERKHASPADALRRDLRRAFGVEVMDKVQIVRSNRRKDTRVRWVAAREMTPRERELFEDTAYTRKVEFHSFRRAFKQGLADAGVDMQTSMALSGASDVKAHTRYLQNTAKMRTVPAAALPRISIAHADSEEREIENPNDIQCRRSDLNRRPHAYEAYALTS